MGNVPPPLLPPRPSLTPDLLPSTPQGSDDEQSELPLDALVAVEEEEDSDKMSSARRSWLCCTWCLTWWVPSFALSCCGRMTRRDIQIAWRYVGGAACVCCMCVCVCAVNEPPPSHADLTTQQPHIHPNNRTREQGEAGPEHPHLPPLPVSPLLHRGPGARHVPGAAGAE
jgi:hypothetical protein